MTLRAVGSLAGLLALVLAMLSTTPGKIAAGTQAGYLFFLPMVAGTHAPVRGTAGCGGDATASPWCYVYWPGWNPPQIAGIETVPLVSSRLMAMAGNPPLVATHLGQYWMLFNEPSNGDVNAGDGISPQQGATLFWQYANQLPDARIVCCGDMGLPSDWMDSFLVACGCLSRLTGISFHDYAATFQPAGCVSDACLMQNWTQHAQAWVNWTRAHSGAYPTRTLELWGTEIGWSPCCEPDEATSLRHMAMICSAIVGLGLTRWAWFAGGSDTQFGTAHIGLVAADGSVNALGAKWGTC